MVAFCVWHTAVRAACLKQEPQGSSQLRSWPPLPRQHSLVQLHALSCMSPKWCQSAAVFACGA